MKAKSLKKKKRAVAKEDWGLKDFVDSVDQVMQKQEKENPAIKQVHARLSPEWKRVSEKLSRLFMLEQEEEIESLREEIIEEGEIATRVLVDFVLAIKKQSNQ